MPWMAAAAVASSYLSSKQQSKNAKRQQQAQQNQLNQAMKTMSPQQFIQYLNFLRPQFQKGYKGSMKTVGDTLALSSQGAQQGFTQDLARRGLQGSNLAQAGRSSIRSARMTGLGDARRKFEMDAEQAARQAAGGSQMAQGQAIQNVGNVYSPQGPSTAQSLLGALGSGATYGSLTGAGNMANMFGVKGGPQEPGFIGPPAPYYVGNAVGLG